MQTKANRIVYKESRDGLGASFPISLFLVIYLSYSSRLVLPRGCHGCKTSLNVWCKTDFPATVKESLNSELKKYQGSKKLEPCCCCCCCDRVSLCSSGQPRTHCVDQASHLPCLLSAKTKVRIATPSSFSTGFHEARLAWNWNSLQLRLTLNSWFPCPHPASAGIISRYHQT